MKAHELKPGDKFWHDSVAKIPNPLTVDKVELTKYQAIITPREMADWRFHYFKDANIYLTKDEMLAKQEAKRKKKSKTST